MCLQIEHVALLCELKHGMGGACPGQVSSNPVVHSHLFHSAGPWDGLWARKGYDPRASADARAYQAVHYHVPVAWQSSIQTAETALSAQPQTDKVLTWPGLPPLGVHPGPVSEYECNSMCIR